MSELEARVAVLEAKVKTLIDLLGTVLPEADADEEDPYSAAFGKFRMRAEEQRRGLRER